MNPSMEEKLEELSRKVDEILHLLRPVSEHASFVGEMKSCFSIARFRQLSGILGRCGGGDDGGGGEAVRELTEAGEEEEEGLELD